MKLKQFSLTNTNDLLRVAAVFFFVLALAGCKDHDLDLPGQNGIQPTGPQPEWGPTIQPQMLAVIEELGRLNPVPLTAFSAQEARTKPTFKDAVNSLLNKNGIAPPQFSVTNSEKMIPGANGVMIPAFIYKPDGVAANAPVIVYYHGGGWVLASTNVYEYSVLALARNTGSIVVSIDYRLAPENKFPTAHEDAYAGYKWVKENAVTFGGNPNKVAVAGESAGGNMAVTVAMMARDRGLGLPVHILSVFPVANNDLNTQSYITYANAKPLSKDLVKWLVDKYFNSPADGDSPLISLVDVANLSGLPPVTIIGAEIDPLQTEGMQLRDKLQSQGVQVTYKLFEGVTHEFFGMYAIVPQAEEAQQLAAKQLVNAFK